LSDKAPDTESYLLSVDDFDKSRLPAHARSPVTAAFKEEVSRLISKDFEGFSGFVRIIVGDAFIEVHYRRDSESTDLVDLAVTRLNSRKYQEGIRLLRMVLSRTPDNLSALGNLGMALSDLGQLDEAELHLRRALKISPESVNVRIALGVALARKDKLDAAITELQRAVLDDPQNAYAHRNLGGCLMKRGDFSTARTLLRRASQLKPDDQQSWFGLAQALAAMALGGPGNVVGRTDSRWRNGAGGEIAEPARAHRCGSDSSREPSGRMARRNSHRAGPRVCALSAGRLFASLEGR
jgi:tetratricopeptide (TPR) repeat protein